MPDFVTKQRTFFEKWLRFSFHFDQPLATAFAVSGLYRVEGTW